MKGKGEEMKKDYGKRSNESRHLKGEEIPR